MRELLGVVRAATEGASAWNIAAGTAMLGAGICVGYLGSRWAEGKSSGTPGRRRTPPAAAKKAATHTAKP